MVTTKKPKRPDTWFVRKLIEMGACPDAIRYARKYRTFPAAWNNCDNDLWMCWLLIDLDLHYCWDIEWNCTSSSEVRRRFPAERVSKALRKI